MWQHCSAATLLRKHQNSHNADFSTCFSLFCLLSPSIHSWGTWLCKELAQSTTGLIFLAQTSAWLPGCLRIESAILPSAAPYQLLITSACSLQHATCEWENNYERTKNSLEGVEDAQARHTANTSLVAFSDSFLCTHTQHTVPHAAWCACKSIKVFVSSGPRLTPRARLPDKCKYRTLCMFYTASWKHLFNATIVLQAQLLQRRNEETTAQQAVCRVWHAQGDVHGGAAVARGTGRGAR